jgi:hypothetical protein
LAHDTAGCPTGHHVVEAPSGAPGPRGACGAMANHRQQAGGLLTRDKIGTTTLDIDQPLHRRHRGFLYYDTPRHRGSQRALRCGSLVEDRVLVSRARCRPVAASRANETEGRMVVGKVGMSSTDPRVLRFCRAVAFTIRRPPPTNACQLASPNQSPDGRARDAERAAGSSTVIRA